LIRAYGFPCTLDFVGYIRGRNEEATVVTSDDMRTVVATGWIRKGREHTYEPCGFPYGGRVGRTHWDEGGRVSRALSPELAASRLRSARRLAAVVARLRKGA
jgi:hypothetical protein